MEHVELCTAALHLPDGHACVQILEILNQFTRKERELILQVVQANLEQYPYITTRGDEPAPHQVVMPEPLPWKVREQERYREDPWSEKVLEFIGDGAVFTIDAILREGLRINSPTGTDYRRVASILRLLGWGRGLVVSESGGRCWAYRKPDAEARI